MTELQHVITERKRLLIYLALSFGLTWAWFLLADPRGILWTDMTDARQGFVALGMLIPLLSHILSRKICGEGFRMSGKDSMMLGISFRDAKWICYVAALLLPWVINELGEAISLLICPGFYDSEYFRTYDIDEKMLFLLPLNAMVSGATGSFAALGEEGGWRGYMMPKLFKLHAKPVAYVIGGIIWGLWHAPLTCIGHNFGTDYPGYPYVGILKMCLLCTLMGIMLTILTERSGSVWPAAVMHGVFNAHPCILAGYVDPDKAEGFRAAVAKEGYMISLAVVTALVLLIDRLIEKRKCH